MEDKIWKNNRASIVQQFSRGLGSTFLEKLFGLVAPSKIIWPCSTYHHCSTANCSLCPLPTLCSVCISPVVQVWVLFQLIVNSGGTPLSHST